MAGTETSRTQTFDQAVFHLLEDGIIDKDRAARGEQSR